MATDLREKIIRATIDIGATKGIENLHIRSVASRCGISAPAIYYHFKNKYDLIHQSMKDYATKLGDYFATKIDPKLTYKENFYRLFYSIPEHKDKNGIIFYCRVRIVPIIMLKMEDHLNIRDNCTMFKFLMKGVESGIINGSADNMATLTYYPLFIYLMNHYLRKTTPTDEDIKQIIDGIWHAVSNQPDTEILFSEI